MRFRLTLDYEAADLEDADSIRKWLADATENLNNAKVAGPSVVLNKIIVHTDGGCDSKRDGVGAWAYVIEFADGRTVECTGTAVGTTNNRMEMQAVIEALKVLPFGEPIEVVSDSEYVVLGITSWINAWIAKGWKSKYGQPVKNQEEWKEMHELYKLHDVHFRHVNGHSGVPGNERCDELCTAAMKAKFLELEA